MSQVSIMSEFRSAYEIGMAQKVEQVQPNPIIETITSFATDKRFAHFEEDLPTAIKSLTETLSDANSLMDGAREIDQVIAILTRFKSIMIKQADEIIEQKAGEGVMQEGNFELEPIEKKSNRRVDRNTLVTEFKPKFDLLLANKIEEINETYTPTIKEIEAVFGKRADVVLIPASVEIVGYKLKMINPMPEQASTGVEL